MVLYVENMSCGHCKMTIEKALADAGVSSFEIDLQNKRIEVHSNELSEKQVIKVIEDKGYHVK